MSQSDYSSLEHSSLECRTRKLMDLTVSSLRSSSRSASHTAEVLLRTKKRIKRSYQLIQATDNLLRQIWSMPASDAAKAIKDPG